MKTDKFENILRKKLEEVSPQYQEADWEKMEKFMNSQKPVSTFQPYTVFLKYAAAACFLGGIVFLYLSQLQENNLLKEDLSALKSQIESIHQNQTKFINNTAHTTPDIDFGPDNTSEQVSLFSNFSRNLRTAGINDTFTPKSTPTISVNQTDVKSPIESHLDIDANDIDPIAISLNHDSEDKLQRQLNSRLSNKEIRKNWMTVTGNHFKAKTLEEQLNQPNKGKQNDLAQDSKMSYRVSAGYQVDKVGIGKSIQGQMIVGKKFSISTGINWLKVKPIEFISEKIFRDRTAKDFKQTHANDIPKSLAVANIKISPSLVQIPLTVAFRENLQNDWAYTIGANTNFNINAKEKITFDTIMPSYRLELARREFEKKLDTPLINSVEISTGIEKAWYPIVVSAEARLFHYFTPINPVSPKTGPGINLKLSYQLGRNL